MSKIDELIKRFKEIADSPDRYVKNYIDETGCKAVGYFYYAPQELIYAAGMLPVGVWGGNIELSAVRSYFPSFFCSVVQTSIEMGIKGKFDYLSGIIIPANCDSLRTMGQNWKVAVPQVEFISLVQPVNRKTEAGVKFLLSEYVEIKKALERIAGITITDQALNNSIEVFNKYRETMRCFTSVAQNYPEIITPSIRHAVIKSGQFMEKTQYIGLVKELVAAIKARPIQAWNGKKIVVTGIKMDSPELFEIFEDNKIAVVADDLAQETRQFRSDVLLAADDPMERLARYWATLDGCSLLYDPDKKRGDMLLEAVRATGADGVLFCMTKFCDPEEFDYPIIKKQLEESKIPHVYVEIDLETGNDEQARTRIQAFAEMV